MPRWARQCPVRQRPHHLCGFGSFGSTANARNLSAAGITPKSDWQKFHSPDQNCFDSDTIYEPVALAAYSGNGREEANLVFFEGCVYKYDNKAFSSVDGNTTLVTDRGQDKSDCWISSAVASNLYNTDDGREIIVCTYGIKQCGSDH